MKDLGEKLRGALAFGPIEEHVLRRIVKGDVVVLALGHFLHAVEADEEGRAEDDLLGLAGRQNVAARIAKLGIVQDGAVDLRWDDGGAATTAGMVVIITTLGKAPLPRGT